MTLPSLIPVLDPIPLPAPYWVFKLLLLATFFLHILAMNSMLGGAVLGLLAWRRSRNDEYAARLFFDISGKLPALLPATITLGVAPLLFVQVIYGQFFYTSSILMAWPWLLALVFLTIAYYGFYFVSSVGRAQLGRGGPVLLLSTALILVIGFIHSNNATLSLTPAAWTLKYFDSPGGWSLNLSEPTLLPRVAHFFAAAGAIGGLVLVIIAFRKWNTDGDYARYVFRLGIRAYLHATMAQVVIGIWFLASLPREQRTIFMGDSDVATVCFVLGVAGALGLILTMSEALRAENPRTAVYAGIGGTALLILVMCIMRDSLRDSYLQPHIHASQFAARTQWSTLPLFLVLFAGGVVLWFVMLKRYGLFGKALTRSK